MFMIKRTIVLLIGFIFLGGLDGYCKEAAPPAGTGGAVANLPAEEKIEQPRVLIRVNGAKIDELDVLGMINTLIPGAAVHGSVSEKKQREIRKTAFERLLTAELLSQEAKKQGTIITKKEIEGEINKFKKRLKKDKTTLEETLKKNRLTMEDLERVIGNNLAKDKIQNTKNKEIKARVTEKVTNEYIEGYYKDNMTKFQIPESTRLREILIRADPSGGQKAWEEAKVRSDEIMKDIKAGKDFAKLAKEFSQDIYAEKGGDMGLGHKGSIIPEVESVAEKLKIGEVAGPIWSIYGYHIIKLEEKVPPKQLTFDEVKKIIREEREQFEFRKMKLSWLAQLKKEAKIEYLNEEDRKMMEATEKKADDKENKH